MINNKKEILQELLSKFLSYSGMHFKPYARPQMSISSEAVAELLRGVDEDVLGFTKRMKHRGHKASCKTILKLICRMEI
jgi:hypothetical protein